MKGTYSEYLKKIQRMEEGDRNTEDEEGERNRGEMKEKGVQRTGKGKMNTDYMRRKGIYYYYRINKERGIQRTGTRQSLQRIGKGERNTQERKKRK